MIGLKNWMTQELNFMRKTPLAEKRDAYNIGAIYVISALSQPF
jgi:hypothetical protein